MADDDQRKLFVAGLPDSVTEQALRDWFQSAGFTTTRIGIPFDRATGRPRGFAFVTLRSDDEAASALKELDGGALDGRSLSVRAFHAEAPKRGGPPGRPLPPPRSGQGSAGPHRSGPPPSARPPAESFDFSYPASPTRATWDEPRRATAGGGRKKEKKEKKKRKGAQERGGPARRGSEGLRSRRAHEDFDDD